MNIISSSSSAKFEQTQSEPSFSLLDKISPFFEFSNSSVTSEEVIFNKKLSRVKSSKGITLLCKTISPSKELKMDNVSYLDHWNSIIGDRMKINKRLFMKASTFFISDENPEVEDIDQMQRVYQFIQSYRPDICQKSMVSQCFSFFGRYLKNSKEGQIICRIILYVCLNKNMVGFTLQSFQQSDIIMKQIISKLMKKHLFAYNDPSALYSASQIQKIVQNFMTNFWYFMKCISNTYKCDFVTYLLFNKLSIISISNILEIILSSDFNNYHFIVNGNDKMNSGYSDVIIQQNNSKLHSLRINPDSIPSDVMNFCHPSTFNIQDNVQKYKRSSIKHLKSKVVPRQNHTDINRNFLKGTKSTNYLQTK